MFLLPFGLPLGRLGVGGPVGSCCCFLGLPRPLFCGGSAGCSGADVDWLGPSPRVLIAACGSSPTGCHKKEQLTPAALVLNAMRRQKKRERKRGEKLTGEEKES